MEVIFRPSKLSGAIHAPVSKSHLHRLLISAALAPGESKIYGVSQSKDVRATVDTLISLGADITSSPDFYTVRGQNMRQCAPRGILNCQESASTLRFIIPVAALSGARVYLCGSNRLLSRPLSVYSDIFLERNMLLVRNGRIITLDGPLMPGDFRLAGDVSSQFISGLLLALPVLDSESNITVLPPFESSGYVDMTLSVLESFDIFVQRTSQTSFKIPGGQNYMPGIYTAERDWSGAAFIIAANYLGGQTSVLGLNPDSCQPDRQITTHLDSIARRDPTPIDLSGCPDLAPILFAMAAELGGASFIGVKRLSIKESSRADAMAEELARMGCSIEIDGDSVRVPRASLTAPTSAVSSHGDHRVAMAMAMLLTKYGGRLTGAECTAKSYPDFFKDLLTLGADIDMIR